MMDLPNVNRKKRLKVALATGMLVTTLCSGCGLSEQNKEIVETKKSSDDCSLIYQLNDKEVILFDDSCNIHFSSGASIDNDWVRIYLDENDSYGNYITVSGDKVTYLVMPDSYNVAIMMANDMVGEDGKVIYYKDYFEDIQKNSSMHR